ncbi:peptidase M15B and M15C DD-carboxypeptidase VanY/endolysin, partial [Arthrobacter nitrophenolicus]
MCHDCSGPPLSSRRSFTRFLAAGAGLTVLTACTPEAPGAAAASSAPSSASPSPVAATASATTTAEAAAVPPAAPEAAPAPSPSAELPRQFSLTDPASPWLIVNKRRPL